MDTPAAESQYYLNKKVFSYVSQTNCKVLKSSTIKTNSLFSLVKKIFFANIFSLQMQNLTTCVAVCN